MKSHRLLLGQANMPFEGFFVMKHILCETIREIDIFISRGNKSCNMQLSHFRKNDLMPLIICKNNKNFVTLFNIIFSNMTSFGQNEID